MTTPKTQLNSFSKPFLGFTAVIAAIALAGCGTDSEADLINGKTLFVEGCGSCHVLKRADTKGVTGPNLDDAFVDARRQGMGTSTFQGIVEQQIHLAEYNMPKDIYKGADARDVAGYVAFAAALPGKDQGALANAGKSPVPTKKITADASNTAETKADATQTYFDVAAIIAKAGKVTLLMGNPSSLPHNIAIKGAGVDELGAVVNKGGESKVTANLKPGKYTFYCSVPGHEAGGMKGDLTVK